MYQQAPRPLRTFIEAYLEALLWSECLEDGTPVDAEYDLSDLESEALEEIEENCCEFFDMAFDHILETSMTFDQAGHDFCLTRNGHGAGFWDRGLGRVGDVLTDMSTSFGTQNVYVGDDNKLYVA